MYVVKLRQPKGPPSEALYPYWKAKETLELIFSWLSWLAVLLMGGFAQQQQCQSCAELAILQLIG